MALTHLLETSVLTRLGNPAYTFHDPTKTSNTRRAGEYLGRDVHKARRRGDGLSYG
jgi:hypothetical protein